MNITLSDALSLGTAVQTAFNFQLTFMGFLSFNRVEIYEKGQHSHLQIICCFYQLDRSSKSHLFNDIKTEPVRHRLQLVFQTFKNLLRHTDIFLFSLLFKPIVETNQTNAYE